MSIALNLTKLALTMRQNAPYMFDPTDENYTYHDSIRAHLERFQEADESEFQFAFPIDRVDYDGGVLCPDEEFAAQLVGLGITRIAIFFDADWQCRCAFETFTDLLMYRMRYEDELEA